MAFGECLRRRTVGIPAERVQVEAAPAVGITDPAALRAAEQKAKDAKAEAQGLREQSALTERSACSSDGEFWWLSFRAFHFVFSFAF